MSPAEQKEEVEGCGASRVVRTYLKSIHSPELLGELGAPRERTFESESIVSRDDECVDTHEFQRNAARWAGLEVGEAAYSQEIAFVGAVRVVVQIA